MSVLQVGQRAEMFGEWLASRPAGQVVFRGLDSVLRLVEKTLMWSIQPAQPTGNTENGAGTSLVIVARPLPWPMFLPLLGVLGVLRVSVYCGTKIFRKPHDTKDMIHWLQTKRRRLRAIKFAGFKNMNSDQYPNENQQSIRTSMKPSNNKTPSKEVAVGVSDSPDHERKRKYCDVEESDDTDDSDDEGVAVKLDKYGDDYHSESDPDFVLNSDVESSDDENVDSGEGEDEDDLEKEVEHDVKVKGESAPVTAAALDSSPTAAAAAPSIVIVEPVSDHGEKQKLTQNLQALEV